MLAIILGESRGAERERVEAIAELLPKARVVDDVPPGASAALIADASCADRVPVDTPSICWLTSDVLTGRERWPAVDALLVPSVDAARAAIQQGYPRSCVYVIAHPIADLAMPALSPSIPASPALSSSIIGQVGLVTAPSDIGMFSAQLMRCPGVAGVVPLPQVPTGDDPQFWRGPGRTIDELAVVILAAVSITGALPALLMARGRPLIAWDVGAAPASIIDGLCGWLVPPHPMKETVRTVQHVLSDRWARESAGIAARDRALARHAPNAVATSVAAAITRATEGVSKHNLRVRLSGAVGAG